jgi:hypothetical protein
MRCRQKSTDVTTVGAGLVPAREGRPQGSPLQRESDVGAGHAPSLLQRFSVLRDVETFDFLLLRDA